MSCHALLPFVCSFACVQIDAVSLSDVYLRQLQMSAVDMNHKSAAADHKKSVAAGAVDAPPAPASAIDESAEVEGYDPAIFVTPPSEQLMCGICTNVARSIVETNCGHVYCQSVRPDRSIHFFVV